MEGRAADLGSTIQSTAWAWDWSLGAWRGRGGEVVVGQSKDGGYI
jgi:hypothetical protein